MNTIVNKRYFNSMLLAMIKSECVKVIYRVLKIYSRVFAWLQRKRLNFLIKTLHLTIYGLNRISLFTLKVLLFASCIMKNKLCFKRIE